MSGAISAPYPPAYALLQPLLGVTTIWADQNAARPQKPYAALRVMRQKSDQMDEYGPVQDDGTQTVSANTEVTLEVQVFGDGAEPALEALRQKLGFQSTVLTCSAMGIAVRSRGPVINITALLDKDTFEDRAAIELVLGYRESAIDTVGIISSVEFLPEYLDAQSLSTVDSSGAPKVSITVT